MGLVDRCRECHGKLLADSPKCPRCELNHDDLPVDTYGLRGWRWLARRRFGDYNARENTLSFLVDGIRVGVSCDRPDLLLPWQLCVTADFLFGLGTPFSLSGANALSRIATKLGAQDIVLGTVRAFDERFVVKAGSVNALRRIWAQELQEQLLFKYSDTDVHGTAHGVVLWAPEITRVEATARFVAALASGGWETTRRKLLDLPDAAYTEPREKATRERPPIVTLPGLVPVSFSPARVNGLIQVRGSARVTGRGLPNELRVNSKGRSGPGADALSPEVLTMLGAVGSARLERSATDIQLTWLRPHPSEKQLRAGLELLRTVASSSVGPYRG